LFVSAERGFKFTFRAQLDVIAVKVARLATGRTHCTQHTIKTDKYTDCKLEIWTELNVNPFGAISSTGGGKFSK